MLALCPGTLIFQSYEEPWLSILHQFYVHYRKFQGVTSYNIAEMKIYNILA